MKAKIYVACHKRDKYLQKIPYDYYIPILCGKAIYTDTSEVDGYLPPLGDNTGDNISEKNKHYCELTGMYWAWKNDNSAPDDIIGMNHYRRYFASPQDNQVLMSKEEMEILLNSNDFIVNGSGSEYFEECCSPEYSVYEAYKGCHYAHDMDNAIKAAYLYFPNLAPRIEHDLKKISHMNLCNLFITKKKYFDDYCNVLFKILSYVESKIDFNSANYQDYQGRVMGFLAERLQRPIIMSLGYTCVQGPCINWEEYAGYKWE